MRAISLHFLTWLGAMLLGCAGLASAGPPSPPWKDARVYSNISYVREAGEWFGVEVVLLPLPDGTTQVLWRSAGPRIDPAVLINAEREMDPPHRLVVKLPDEPGRWVLEEKGRMLIATRSDGNVLRVRRISR